MLANYYCWTLAPHRHIIYIARSTPLKKKKLFPIGYQLQIAFGLGVRSCVSSSFSCCDVVWFKHVGCFLHTVPSLWVHMRIGPVVPEWCCFLGIILACSLLLFCIDHWAFRRGFDEDIYEQVSQSLSLCPMSICRYLCPSAWTTKMTLLSNSTESPSIKWL